MKPVLVADEMFPEGANSYMDIEEVYLKPFRKYKRKKIIFIRLSFSKKLYSIPQKCSHHTAQPKMCSVFYSKTTKFDSMC